MWGMSVRKLEEDYLGYELGLTGCGNVYNYSVAHWDHGSWASTTDDMGMTYVPGTAAPPPSSSSSFSVPILVGVGVGVFATVAVLCYTVAKCRSSKRSSGNSNKRISAYAGGGGGDEEEGFVLNDRRLSL